MSARTTAPQRTGKLDEGDGKAGLSGLDEEELYELVWDAERDGLVEIGIDLRNLNRAGSPVFSVWDNGIPGIVFVTAVLVTLVFAGWIWALAMAASGLILLLTSVNFLVMMRLRRRAWTKARSNLRNWQEIWRHGGLSLRLTQRPDVEAHSPDADWRDFARLYLTGSRHEQP